MTFKVLDPTSETQPPETIVAARPASLAGKTVGIISNGKEGTKGFFSHLDQLLRQQFGVAQVVLQIKSNFSAPAEPEIIAQAGGWDLAITGIGD